MDTKGQFKHVYVMYELSPRLRPHSFAFTRHAADIAAGVIAQSTNSVMTVLRFSREQIVEMLDDSCKYPG
jgi:hypothetical protein